MVIEKEIVLIEHEVCGRYELEFCMSSFKLSILKLPTASAAELTQRSLLLNKDYLVIGRSEKCDLVLFDEHRLISREHFSLKKQNTDWILTVLSTVNSVQVGDREVGSNEQHILVEGEHIFLGAYELLFETALDDNKTQFAPIDASKDNDPFGSLPKNNVSPILSDDDPFGFLDKIEPTVSAAPDPLLLSGVVDVFGLDEVKIASSPTISVLDIGGISANVDTDPFAFMNGSSMSDNVLNSEQGAVVDVFGLDSTSPDKLSTPIINDSPSPFEHIHPINEPIPMPVINNEDTTSVSSLINTDSKKLLIDALGLDYERFANIDEKELIQRVGFLLSNSMSLIVDLLRLRSVTKVEVGTVATTLAINNNNPLKYSPNSVVALGYLLGKQQIGFMSYQEAVKSTREDLVSYNKDLLNVTQKLGKHILQELSPVTIETNLDAKGGFSLKIPVQREAKLWTEYKKIHESCDANLDQIIKKVF